MKIQDTDPPEYHLMVLNSQIRAVMDSALRPHGIKLVEWRLVQCLADEGALSICDLSQLAVVERTKTSRLVDKLVERNLVAREQLAGDRRYSHVRLCEPGQDLLNACSEDVERAREQLFDGLDQKEIGSLLAVLKKMQQNALAPYRRGPQAKVAASKRASG